MVVFVGIAPPCGGMYSTTKSNSSAPLSSRDVMTRLGYRDRKSFWEAVHRQGIPCTRITARKIVFFEPLLNDWLARRTSGKGAA